MSIAAATLLATCDRPHVPAMEAVGGTGDTITGIIAALRYRGDPEAELKALILNRIAGELVECTPATQIKEFITAIPAAIERYEKQ